MSRISFLSLIVNGYFSLDILMTDDINFYISNGLPQVLWEFIQFADSIWLMPWCKLRFLWCLLTWVKSFARGHYDKWPNYACLLFVRYQMIRSNLISYSSNHISVRWLLTLCCCKKLTTTLQSMMNAKLSQHRFWHCHENGLISHQDDSNNTLQPIGECQVSFPLLTIRINQYKP